MCRLLRWCLLLQFLSGLAAAAPQATRAPATFSVATYNLENYLLEDRGTRPGKPEAARERICESLVELNADVVALQEVGGFPALLELRDRLSRHGLHYPHTSLALWFDTNIQVAVLSRLPILADRSHTNATLLVQGRRLRTSRGALELDFQSPGGCRFTLLAVHLKSRLETGPVPQEQLREQEALWLRRLVDTRFKHDPRANLIVLGDLNDLRNSRTVRTLISRGNLALIDTRPAEPRPGGLGPAETRSVTWTHFYAQEDVYSRIDYILISRTLVSRWQPEMTFVLSWPRWGEASDHRPLIARFLDHAGR
jgi:endonuclease/exonuclease/phosphatase family metal-dependent hydrolase